MLSRRQSAASALATLCRPGTFSFTSTTSPVSRALTLEGDPVGDGTGDRGEQIGSRIARL